MFRSIMAGMGRAALATARFVGRATMEAAERLIPQGSSEVSNLLFANHSYHPIAPLPRGGPALRQANLEARQQQPDRSMQMER